MEEEEQKEQIKDENTEQELEKLRNSKFKQQLLPAWRPVPTVFSTSIIFTVFGIVFLALGITLLVFSNKIVDVKVRYDDQCKGLDNCKVKVIIGKEIKPPIMMYYELDNFYQNHRMYVKSHSDDQLKGKEDYDKNECDPVITNKEMDKTLSVGFHDLDPDATAVPCGSIAKSFFNDSFALEDEFGESIFINETGIAWEADVKNKFKNGKDWEKKQWIDMTNEHFIVWMRPAGLEGFRKLWGRITERSLVGDFYLKVINNYNVSKFDGKKFIIFSNANKFGGKNYLLSYAYIVVGILSLVVVLLYLIITQFKPKKKKTEKKE